MHTEATMAPATITEADVAMARAAEARAQAAYERARNRLAEAGKRLWDAIEPLRVSGATDDDRDAAIVAQGAEAAARQDAYRAARLCRYAKHATIRTRMQGASEQDIALVIACLDGRLD